MRAQRIRKWSSVLVLGVLMAAGGRLAYVHAHTWQWALGPSAAAPKLEFVERTYLRGRPQESVPSGWTPQGRTPGGGTIIAPPPSAYAPTGVCVRTGTRLVAYTLSGGP